MKVFLFIICVAASITACTKTDVGPQSLVGTWELRHYSGTIAGVNQDVPAGSGNELQFNTDSTFRHFTNFKVDDSGHFRIIKNGVTWGDGKHDAIFLGEHQNPYALIIKADSLVMGDTIPDGVTTFYVRKR